ncbi:hypothetical protein [Paraliomyxa miuraensis]|uniref:hypothetical protein n=1 Tax=Paraliomyxa miuraensis TaxID=376150 RepID=UPI00225666AE|nr:hypothetical protein [Paraliomyxa miuraensis]MCX4245288.1 hypothetical protein [Paraliomyxa miuraensis]
MALSSMLRRASPFALVALACGRTPMDFPPHAGGGGGDGSSSTGPTVSDSSGQVTCIDAPELCVAELSLRRAVDILFVIDNSGSMGSEQGALADSFGTFVQVLESQQVGANYRIGITTTDNFYTPGGTLRATSCRSRLDEFESSSMFGDKDERQRGCLDNCALDSIPLAEPWVEKGNGQTNLPTGVDMTQALQCIGPQGISGDGFEAPLESMRLALLDDDSGFLRNDAILAVIFVTDEIDCSMSLTNRDWLLYEGDVFWSSPDRPSSGSCWLAGVSCIGGPGVFEDCFSENKGQDGLPTAPDASVVYPVQRYVDTLTELAARKQAQGGQSEVLIAVLAGVPLDYPETGVHLYADSPDEEFNQEYGIGPSCNRGTETLDDPPGIPSVRLREFAEAFASAGSRNIFSVCNDDYGVALEGIADAIGDVNTRACVAGCVSDARYDIPGMQAECALTETFADGTPDRAVVPCAIVDWGWDFPAPDVHACYRVLTDPAFETPEATDDMSPQCVTLGSNVELVVERREGVPVPAGTAVSVRCNLDAPIGYSCADV